MTLPFVDLKAQYLSIKPEIDRAIEESLTQASFVGGDAVVQFEEAFARYVGANRCVACANGTDSMEMILKALEVGVGDEVIVPSNSWISTAEVVSNVGAEPIFVDVLEEEYTINPELIEEKITARTKAIIPVHLYGLPARLDEIMEISKAHSLHVIEDCAQAHGAEYKGRRVGTFGVAGSFSFYPGKNLGAYGDGGCVVTNDEELAEKIRMIGNHGQKEKHNHLIIGRNSRLDTLQARILLAKLPHLDKWTQDRINNASYYSGNLSGAIKPVVPEGMRHVFHLYVIRVKSREKLMNKLVEAGVGHAIHYPFPLPLVPAYAYQGHTSKNFPIAYRLSKEIISIPMYAELTRSQMDRVIECIPSS